MPTKRQLFLSHVTQTSPYPMIVEVERAEGIFIYDVHGKRYYDMDSGFSVSSLGHRHPAVIRAIEDQLGKYLHTTVYGEHIQSPQIQFATQLTRLLNNRLQTVYYTNSGSEAVEVAIKAARKYTGRYGIISCRNAYHGSTLGAESLRSDIAYTSSFMPGMPGVSHIDFNAPNQFENITSETAAVILEPVQAEAGVILPQKNFLQKLRQRCNETGTLLVLDEIQTGFGRTGSLFAFQQYQMEPDILLMAKAMGGGLPAGAAMSASEILGCLTDNPPLGHITTFGGHPLCIAAACSVLEVLTSGLMNEVNDKAQLFLQLLQHKAIKEVRSSGLLMGISLKIKAQLPVVVSSLLEAGVITDFFLFNDESFRLAPPLIITPNQIREVCDIILKVLDRLPENP